MKKKVYYEVYIYSVEKGTIVEKIEANNDEEAINKAWRWSKEWKQKHKLEKDTKVELWKVVEADEYVYDWWLYGD